jgi:hypothetical protein
MFDFVAFRPAWLHENWAAATGELKAEEQQGRSQDLPGCGKQENGGGILTVVLFLIGVSKFFHLRAKLVPSREHRVTIFFFNLSA